MKIKRKDRQDRKGSLKTETICITTNSIVTDLLRRLVETGLYGFGPEEAAERLICEALKVRMEKK